MRFRPFSVVLFLILLAVIGGIFYWREHRYDEKAVVAPAETGIALAYFAGGCFWCTEADFEKLAGVIEAVSGYAGGHLENPTYPEVVKETTGHRETVEVRYDPNKVTYRTLAEYFFAHIDPTDAGGQFVDRGESYTSAIFYQSAEEHAIAEDVVKELTKTGAYEKPIVTSLLPLTRFWIAEEYHQDYYKKNPLRYDYYRGGSGRDQRLKELCDFRATKKMPCDNDAVKPR
ncbi:MAG: peptide-methionine (S)-S-oxide reductase [Candidatus Lloydbacteria bacterium RIFCSPHIGHO2_02_FULL_54_17]|uniref:Peptide methionine sulfoxide reductase MsrA n=1 Tax=Candidatus Lloydbacteria bacterium RIFCSPHIGHO2_02_FULL_54_17 TaxID=1798664 RepID=A0A1G2DIR5_9BACT|nr:MAG: peptide-methionine (S)-S-oxide reductase [Candidatus Lloydbacteria bacterium RIFCSPHIGHO2_01_FULL_54_11]OGZ12698.1 MAG: peptide-methionine (S)-S-oxide reductase [Candidatus Lloydbacteria bacterium RIFCSPHIGHO2_02_FULL_54_17]OGZ13550.1 MAG: peptide-methionine (S)-S-oxide reductase [Candidatus Lloydbacteria bacterium RIFCSPLOWO2_01_FULL_54_18]OGZ16219.1 MAG: peptide-methionine (S)-S-oxide reductase [Candidatus Lloydbacteria bacterium RIFCSPLOWO2_02_FULL_54_12]